MTEIGRQPPVKWDDRLRRGKKDAALTDAVVAEKMLYRHLEAWHKDHAEEEFKLLSTEKTIWVDLNRPAGWRINCRLDTVIEIDGAKVIRDFKTASKLWDQAKFRSHSAQGQLYMAAEAKDTGVIPDRFEFHIFVKGTDDIQILTLDFDAAAINRYIEYQVRPTIRAIEAEAFVANRDWWGCSSKWCPYWNHCAAIPPEEKTA